MELPGSDVRPADLGTGTFESWMLEAANSPWFDFFDFRMIDCSFFVFCLFVFFIFFCSQKFSLYLKVQ